MSELTSSGGPRSLQNRNTKNLSIAIEHQKPELTSLQEIPEVRPQMQSNFSSGTIYRRSTLDSDKSVRKPGNTIYSVIPKLDRVQSASPIYASSMEIDNKKKLGRVHSLSLSIKTKNLPTRNSNSLKSGHIRNRSFTMSGAETSTPLITDESESRNLKKEFMNKVGSRVQQQDFDMDAMYSEIYQNTAYTEGPLLVVEPSIYLYSEPNLSVILNYDVVINVAKEIDNLKQHIPAGMAIDYYHVPWTHASQISKDLAWLTEVMHTAVTKGKKILVHCQCGVSRSASLIVGYMMRYENLALNDAYAKLKEIAKDISPNMGLIFQLMEWNDMLPSLRNNEASSKTTVQSMDMSQNIPLETTKNVSTSKFDNSSYGMSSSITISDTTSGNSPSSANSISLQNESFPVLNSKELTLTDLSNNNILNGSYKNAADVVADSSQLWH